jgi:hypothetical protein
VFQKFLEPKGFFTLKKDSDEQDCFLQSHIHSRQNLNFLIVEYFKIRTDIIMWSVASTKDTTLIGRISDDVQPELGTDFFA